MALPTLVLGLGAGAAGLVGYKLYEDQKHPKLQSLKHTDPATGKPVQVIVPVKAPKPVAHVSTVPIAGQNAQVIWGSGTGVRYVPPTVIKANQTPGRLDLLPTVITPTGASSLAVMTLADVQNALNTLGFGPLLVDGKLGQATQAAVAHYQSQAGLSPDGNPGPQTKGSLQHALATLAAPGAALGAHPMVVSATPQTPAQVAAAVTGQAVGGLVAQNQDLQRAMAVASTASTVARDVSNIAHFFGVDADPRFDPLYGTIGPAPAGTIFYPDPRLAPRTRRAVAIETMTEDEARRRYGRRDHVETLGDVQEALNRLGASPALGLTGTLNPQSVAAIRAFQITHGLLADGVPGPKTRTALTLALLGAGQSSEFGLTLFTLFGAEPPPVGSRFGLARTTGRRPGGGGSGRTASAVRSAATRGGRKRHHHHYDPNQQQAQQQQDSGGGGGGDQGGGGGGGDGGGDGGGGAGDGGNDGGDDSDVSGERAFG
jgi:peptidoglycan hydrolase-like protein with peptidoglycan-binding domain